MTLTGKQLTTQLDADGTLTVQLNDKTWDAPEGSRTQSSVPVSGVSAVKYSVERTAQAVHTCAVSD